MKQEVNIMGNRIKAYKAYIDSLLDNDSADTDWEEAARQHLIQLEFFMHERLIHLIVTITFALLEIICLAMVVTSFSLPVGILFLLILVLLIPYVSHYYLLENSVQYMYGQYDRMMLKLHKSSFIIEKK